MFAKYKSLTLFPHSILQQVLYTLYLPYQIVNKSILLPMKSLFIRHLLFLIFVSLYGLSLNAQNHESGLNLSADPHIVNAPENAPWLLKTGRLTPNYKSVYFYEGFEEPTEDGNLPEGWKQKRTATPNEEPVVDAESPKWFRNSTSYGFPNAMGYVYSGTGSMAIGYTAEDFTWAISPEFSIPETEGDVFLSYWAWIRSALPTGFDEPVITNYFVKVKADDEWFTLYSYFGVDGEENIFDEQLVHTMNPFKGQDVQIAFVYEYFGWQMAVDEIFVGEALEDDFGIENLALFPTFGLLPGDQVIIGLDVYCNGSNSGSVDVELWVNDELLESHTTGELVQGEDTEFVLFSWIASSYGHFDLEIRLPEDQFLANNVLSEQLFVNQYFNIAEDFENFEFDDLGLPNLIWPPHGWTVNDAAWVTVTEQWPIFDDVSAVLHGRIGQGEKALYTQPIDLTFEDQWISFYLAGVNNNVTVNEEGANPPGEQGFSTFQLKYSPSADGPWTNLGDPIEFKRVWHIDEEGDTLGSTGPNVNRFVQHDISHLNGTYYFAFTATSNFSLVIDQTAYRSFVVIDNIMVGRDIVIPVEMSLETKDAGGNPLADVLVHLFRNDQPVRVLKTEESGVVELQMDPAEYTYKAYKLGKGIEEGTMTVESPAEEENKELQSFEITMHIPDNLYKVVFHITDENGNNIEDASLKLSEYYFHDHSTADGLIEIAGFVPGTFSVEIAANGYVPHFGEFTVEEEDLVLTVALVSESTQVMDDAAAKAIIYPNPASDRLHIKADFPMQSVQIYSLTGEKVYHEQLDAAENITLDIAGLNVGIYIVRLENHGSSVVKMLNIQR